MATLIWSKVRNIRIGDTHVPFEVKYDDGSSLVADSSSMGYNLAQAVNGEGGMELCLREIQWSLNRGQPDYDWASFWQIADAEPNIIYFGSGDIGYLRNSQDYGLKRVGYHYDAIASKYTDEFNMIDGQSHAPLQPYWNIENESVYVDIPVPTKEGQNYWYQDDDGVWKLYVRQNSTYSGYQTLHSNLGDMGDYPESATWHNPSLDGTIYVPLEDITNEILYGLTLTLTQNQSSVIERIHGTTYNTSSYSSFVPMSITQEAPDFDFSVSLSGLSNLSQLVVAGETAEGTATITSSGFNGNINVYAFDHADDIASFNSMLQTSLDESDQAQYGTVDYESAAYSISAGESIDVPITYNSEGSVSQTDSYSIIVYISSLDLAAYEDFSFEAQQQFDDLAQSDKIAYSDVPTIQIISSQEVPVETYTPSEQLIEKPSDIIFHLAEQEFGYNKNVDYDSIYQSRLNHKDWDLAFTINKKISSKKLFQEIAKSSKLIPSFGNDKLSMIDIKTTYRGGTEYYPDDSDVVENISLIKRDDVIRYKMSRTPIEDVKTQVEVKYQYDYGGDRYPATTDKLNIEHIFSSYFTTASFKDIEELSDFSEFFTNYYGVQYDNEVINHVNTYLEVENKYIRSSLTALDFCKYLLLWHCNQHNIIDVTLPLKYYNYEVGDLIEFDKMIKDKELYGEKYTLDSYGDMPIRAGQYILPLFMITETKKGLENVKIKVVQLHHMEESKLNYKGYEYRYLGTDPGTILDEGVIVAGASGTGDVNEDGLLNILDLVIIVNGIIGATELTDDQEDIADENQDTLVNILDLVALINRVVGG